MRKIIFLIFASFVLSVSINAQTTPPTDKTTETKTETKPKKPIFRANKEQIMQAQKMLQVAESGKLDNDTRAAIKKYQPENGLKATGTLNRATLEKMGIELTDKQKEIPVSPSSYATAADTEKPDKPKKVIFRASKEQIMQAQKILKENGMYSGEETGKLDDATRASLKKYQEANGIKVTGTLNQVTIEKMGIALTDKQKEMAKPNSEM
ncbi:MAG: peptidoglycan-binding protein [Acidobacteriota bacterium]|jgi:peptidoglycan hydrolase-like protein with peptidoglycan-binding domain|nr:peptidoglycan-binding protein [Acidobacteriota bacterium]